ncbi:hypothetical protein P153DRAFT_363848 [Dothidotthia symphoricarpi CBS 119687]|uniref:Extracellular membrane protein CFEM domain-containing protein n=1 Tax=Dothidotthia symphoricarpi CBS 119687 TaxID=1392245 RepID=A0A6A6AN17_9PLEO|nr:uncharacterized protein P153DRAFT_363848 [Dothidotthia symphoricarpi CBS 119687]KAF2132538.1 hypothetical protein P153DRAFT_363848 [Dothidotthia symphoricarpi CBS 119687]
MKYTVAILTFVIGAFAIPQQASSITSAPATTAAPSNYTSQLSCASACDATDVDCRAACLGVAHPNASQAIETTECAASCDQGDGSTEDTQKFSDCVQGCIYSLYPSSQTFSLANAAIVSSAASAVGSVTNSASATATGSATTGSSSGTGSNAQATGAANSNSAHFAGAGLAGLMAVFAL